MLAISIICVIGRADHRLGYRPRRRVPSDRLSGAGIHSRRAVPRRRGQPIRRPRHRDRQGADVAPVRGGRRRARARLRHLAHLEPGGDPGGGRREGHPAGRFRPRGHAGPLPAPGDRPASVLGRLALDAGAHRRDLRRSRGRADRRRDGRDRRVPRAEGRAGGAPTRPRSRCACSSFSTSPASTRACSPR